MSNNPLICGHTLVINLGGKNYVYNKKVSYTSACIEFQKKKKFKTNPKHTIELKTDIY